ncbi:MAG: hypothetical protein AAF598_18485 [Bacteroidota bacterium]
MKIPNHYLKIIIYNSCFIVGFYLAFLSQVELTPSKIIGFLLLIVGYNTWLFRKQKKEEQRLA